jgi:cobaltochelatase CobN
MALLSAYIKQSIFTISFFAILTLSAIAMAENISFMVIDSDTYLVNKAIKELIIPGNIKIKLFTFHDIKGNSSAREFIDESEVIIVDVMMSDLSKYLIENVDTGKKRIYALRGSRDDEGLKKKGFIFNPDISEYFSNLSIANIQNLIYRVAHLECDPSITYKPVKKLPSLGIYHSDSKSPFTDYEQYLKWYKKSNQYNKDAPWIGLMLFSTSLIQGQRKTVDYLIKRLEDEGFNVLAAFGRLLAGIIKY